jgi:hypothetical protein
MELKSIINNDENNTIIMDTIITVTIILKVVKPTMAVAIKLGIRVLDLFQAIMEKNDSLMIILIRNHANYL